MWYEWLGQPHTTGSILSLTAETQRAQRNHRSNSASSTMRMSKAEEDKGEKRLKALPQQSIKVAYNKKLVCPFRLYRSPKQSVMSVCKRRSSTA